MKRKLIGLILTLTALVGLILSMNESANHINAIGFALFGSSCFLGARHAKNKFHPVTWIRCQYDYYLDNFKFWRL